MLLIPYHSYELGLPQQGRHLLGQCRGKNIIVYQAFNEAIADYAVKNQRFGGSDYSFSRMTWIKPNFLWMMYRSGWASKKNQERVLAIEIPLQVFLQLLSQGVPSSYNSSFADESSWKTALQNSDVCLQWDPDHDANGKKLNRRAIQIGIRAQCLEVFNNAIVSIEDISPFVKTAKAAFDEGASFAVPLETLVEMPDSLKNQLKISTDFFPGAFITGLLQEFEQKGSISDDKFGKILLESSAERLAMLAYIRNYTHAQFSRYLLKKALSYRLQQRCMCEDLLFFAYFVSKNGTAEDFNLIFEAKTVDFDAWCSFDGELIFGSL